MTERIQVGKAPPGREDIFALYGVPRTPTDDNAVSCLMLIVYNEQSPDGGNPLPSVLPDYWKGKFVPHFAKIEEGADEYGFTHLALLEGPTDVGVAFNKRVFFSRGILIRGAFVILGFNEATQQYHHLHCQECAAGVAEWFIEKQPKWKVLYETNPRLHGPAESTTRH